MFNLKEMLDVAASTEAVTFEQARRSLPIAYLLEHYGHTISTVETNGRLKLHCPFPERHDGGDSNPSFTVFGEGLEHWSCWSCGAKGDAVDLLKAFEPDLIGLSVGATYEETVAANATTGMFRRVRELITEVVDSGWTGPSTGENVKPFDIDAATEIVDTSQDDPDYARIREFIEFKREQRGRLAWPYSAEYLIDEWRVGTYGTWMVIPYWDVETDLIAYKRWTSPERTRMSAEGTGIWTGHLYGDWRPDDGSLDILLCEGESDAWYAHYHVGHELRVLSLPTGSDTPTAAASRLAGRTVLLAFDGDKAGRRACRAWAEALEGVNADVRIVPVPDGKDLSTAGDIRILLSQSRPPVKAPSGITATAGGYRRSDANGNSTDISNWTFVPERGLHGDGAFAFEGRLRPGGNRVVITSADLASENKAQTWAALHGKSWYGNSRDARKLLGVLQAEDVFLPSGRLVSMAGLHDGTFVWPGGRIGPEPIVYIAPSTDANLAGKIRIEPGQGNPGDLVDLMLAMQKPEITEPLLAWMAAAPLRSLYERFPFVTVTGAHGSGKTETTETLVRAFSGSSIEQTFESTAYAIVTSTSSTNAFLVQLEERRKNARQAALEAGDNIFRAAYTMTPLERGGMGDNFGKLTASIPAAPIIVTGEDMLVEGSHTDRMVQLNMNSDYQNAAAFEAVRAMDCAWFPHMLLTFYRSLMEEGVISLDGIPVVPAGPKDLTTRQRYNIGVLMSGWSFLKTFLSEHNAQLGKLHLEGIIDAFREANKHTPYEEAINYCLGEPDAMAFVRYDKAAGTVKVQVQNVLVYLGHPSRSGLFTLPGGKRAFEDYCLTRLGGTRTVENMREYIFIPYDRIAPK